MTASSNSHTVLWVPRYWPAVGGTEFHSHELAKHLSSVHRVTVLTHCTRTENPHRPLTLSAASTRFSQTMKDGVRSVHLAPDKRYAAPLSRLGRNHGQYRLARLLYQFGFSQAYRHCVTPFLQDADRIHFIYNGLTEAAHLAARFADAANIPFIFTPNILNTAAVGSDWDSAGFHQLYSRADHLIALTEHEAQWLVERGVSREKISVIPYGPILAPRDASEETGTIKTLLSTRYILFLGRLVPGKGFDFLRKAFETLHAEDPDTHLIMIGPAIDDAANPLEPFNQQREHPCVHLLHDVSQPLKSAFLAEAEILCVPSDSESLGGVYIEAMASGTPVVALDRPVSRCVIEHGREGILVTRDEHSLINGLRAILDNPERAQHMGRLGKQKVDEQFSWPIITRKICKVYEALNETAYGRRVLAR